MGLLRFRAVNDHGNGSYRWFCEIRLYAIHSGGYAYNAALGKPTDESSVWNSRCTDCYNADRAVDGLLPLHSKNSVENCFHSDSEATNWMTIDLEEETEVTSITISGRTHQTNQGDNLVVSVGNQVCGGEGKVWHTNGKGGQVYTNDFESTTVEVPCNLTGSSVRIEVNVCVYVCARARVFVETCGHWKYMSVLSRWKCSIQFMLTCAILHAHTKRHLQQGAPWFYAK